MRTNNRVRLGTTAICSLAAIATLTVLASSQAAAATDPVRIVGNPPTSVTAGQAYEFRPWAWDQHRTRPTFTISNRPSWANFNSATGSLTGTPTSANVGSYAGIVIAATDGEASAELPAFTVKVDAAAGTTPTKPTTPPTISGTPTASITVGTAYSFKPTASGPSGTTLTFSVANAPQWASFNTGTGALSGTPTAAEVGTASGIVISVSDGTASASLASFSIAVTQMANGSATLTWTPPTENTNGSALSNLAGYEIDYGTSSSALNQTVQLASAGLATYVLSNLSPGTWFFGVQAYTSGGQKSAVSNVVSKTIN